MARFVFISGWAQLSAAMHPLEQALSFPHAIKLSLAELDKGGHTCPDYSAGLTSRLEAEPDERFVLVGWSTGGIVALETAIRWPGKIAGLVLISSTPHFCRTSDSPWGIEETELRGLKLGIRRKFEKTMADFLQKSAWPRQLSSEQLQIAVPEVAREGIFPLERGLTYLRQADLRPHLDKVMCPCLLMHGQEDCIVSWRASEWMNSKINSVRCRVWSDEGHDMVKQEASGLAEDIICFVEKCI